MKYGLFFGLTLITSTASAQLTPELDAVLAAHTKPDQPGIALKVEVNGHVLYEKSAGVINTRSRKPITSMTNFRMASVSKQFTAMAILLLEKQGKLSLTDPIRRFFPAFNQRAGDQVLIRHLLTHSSGLPDYESVMNPDQKKQLLDADILNLLAPGDSLYFTPGTQFRYSNSGFCLLALIVEKVSGQSFPSFVAQHIFAPLHMTGSRVYIPGKPLPDRAIGYARNEAGVIYFSDQSVTSATKGDGGVYTSLNDYQKWSNALRNNTLIDLEASLASVRQPIPQPAGSFYGDGWFFTQSGELVLFHSGSTCGFSTFVIHVPAKRLQVTFFSNLANQDKAFSDVLQVLKTNGTPYIGNVMALHQLTR
nr:serine hydrolase domain-containing protein [uncultured Arsenicibacter sp.]